MLRAAVHRWFGQRKCLGSVQIGKHAKIRPVDLVIGKNAKGSITLGQWTVCQAQLYSFRDRGRIEIGDYCFLGENSKVWALEKITIGHRVMVSHNCFIVDNLTHPMDPGIRHAKYLAKIGLKEKTEPDLEPAPVVVEDDVWVGACAILLPGVRVGQGSVIGAGAVVTTGIPPRVLAVGNPARVVRSL
jgi:acetyltransferase-like isoleucine patch superfamily enzyme